LENWFEAEFLLLKILKLQPSELDRFEFWRAEILMENLKNWNEKENEHRKQQEKDQQSSFGMDDARRGASDMMKNANQGLPSWAQSSSFNPGSFRMPSMPSMPSMPKFL